MRKEGEWILPVVMAQRRLDATEELRRDTRDRIPKGQGLVTGVPVTFHSSRRNDRGSFVMIYVLKPVLSHSNKLPAT